ncbi:MAG: cation:proton antiporter [Alphaproteobacteria bacterium]
MHTTPLIGTLVAAFVAAFVLGTLAQRLRISPIVGYLLAGILVGPHTPGFTANQPLATELSDIGITLLMFGVGLHFSVKELRAVRGIVLPGALAAIAIMTFLGSGLGLALGWAAPSAVLFGLSLSVASTVVVLRVLEEHHELQTERGRIAIGWLVVEDGAMVLALVLVPALVGLGSGAETNLLDILAAIGLTLAKIIGFVLVMLVIGRRLIPMILHFVAHSGSRELFRLAVLALSFGTAFGVASLFGVSFALGAFFAGMVLAESTLSQQAAREILPLRDAFAVLFFVSVGMLVDPSIIWRNPLPLAATVIVVLIGKSAVAYGVMRLSGRSHDVALFMSSCLAQIGEFSFILAGLGITLGIFESGARDLILATSIASILVNPMMHVLRERSERRAKAKRAIAQTAEAPEPEPHAIVIGYGRLGRRLVEALGRRGVPTIVIELEEAEAKPAGAHFICGNGASPDILAEADLKHAGCLFIAIPDAFEAGQIAEQAKAANAKLKVIAGIGSAEEADHLVKLGADRTISGEAEIAQAMVRAAFERAPQPPG